MRIFVAEVYVLAEDLRSAHLSLDARLGTVTDDPSIPNHTVWYSPGDISLSAQQDPDILLGEEASRVLR